MGWEWGWRELKLFFHLFCSSTDTTNVLVVVIQPCSSNFYSIDKRHIESYKQRFGGIFTSKKVKKKILLQFKLSHIAKSELKHKTILKALSVK